MKNAQHCYSNGSSPDRRGGGEKQEEVSPLEGFTRTEIGSNMAHLQGRTPPPSPALPSSASDEKAEDWRERADAARLLKSCGVKFYSQMARDYSPALIKAKVEEWRIDPDLGPGMLVKMIQGRGPVVGDVAPIERPAAPSGDDWFRDRYESGRVQGDEDEDDRWQ